VTATETTRPPEMEGMGPVSYLIVEFPGGKMSGEGLPKLVDLVEQGLIRILDLEFVTHDPDGTIRIIEVQDIDRQGIADLEIFDGVSSHLLNEDDIADVDSVIEPGSSAAILIYENRWAKPFVQALRHGGAQPVAAGFIPHDSLAEALEATEG
jgi:Family of unknown function (DUF6325)